MPRRRGACVREWKWLSLRSGVPWRMREAKVSSERGWVQPEVWSSWLGVEEEGEVGCRLLLRSASMKMKPWREGSGLGVEDERDGEVEARYWSMECWAWRGWDGGHQARVSRALVG